ncbi:hypothetical protein B296_00045733 [Ensete ventricosum]|uniref:Uncharacterized protein n=1 Tax=Ensete ventricosum TaxID=4639 RepID=A0A426Y273_ENSVE|nr:hypothetical protein B296_00045733 [Ensete ventricosum]
MRLQLRDVDITPLTLARSTLRRLTLPCLCQAGSNTSGRPRRWAYCPRVRGRGSHVNICHIISLPPEKTFSRLLTIVPKMRPCNEPSSCGERLGNGSWDLAEKVNSGTSPGDLAERVNSGINFGELAERVNSGTNPRDLVEMVNSGTNPGDLVEKVNSGTNSGDLAGRVNSGTNSGDLVERMDLGDLRGMPKMSDGKAPSTCTVAPAREVDVSPAREAPKASFKRSIDAPTEQVDDPARRHKKVKVLTRRHKSQHDEGESRSYSKGKEPAAPSEEPETPAESDEGGASPVHHRPRSMKALFKTKVHKDDTSLSEIQRLLKEAQVRAQKMDDELLQSIKALENARAELPRQLVDHYKESVGFKEGLKRMGRVTYEYGYRVALARFHALHPDSKVEEDPFTIHPEDDLVPMERQQAFDDSDLLES